MSAYVATCGGTNEHNMACRWQTHGMRQGSVISVKWP